VVNFATIRLAYPHINKNENKKSKKIWCTRVNWQPLIFWFVSRFPFCEMCLFKHFAHFLLALFFSLLHFSPTHSLIFLLSGKLCMVLHIFLNILPCSGLWKKSANMFVVGQNATFTSPFCILSVTKKYSTIKCHVLIELEVFPKILLIILIYGCCGKMLLLCH